jgi:RNA polymerase sigma-70 factor (ECF subfamily)
MERGSAAFLPWLRGITRFKVMEYFRHRSAEPNADGGSDHIRQLHEVHAPNDDDSSFETQDEERQILLRQALHLIQSQFQPHTWEAFWETVVENRPTVEVAEELGMTTLAIRQARWRILQKLREELGDILASFLPDAVSTP